MAMTREEAAAYAASEFQELLADAGLIARSLTSSIDRAMRSRGLPLTGPVPDDGEHAFLAVLDWAVLLRIERALAQRVDVSVEGPTQSKKYSQAVAHVRTLREDAWSTAQSYILIDEGSDDWEYGTIQLGLMVPPPKGVY